MKQRWKPLARKVQHEKRRFGLASAPVKAEGPSENAGRAVSSDDAIALQHSGQIASLVIIEDDGIRRSEARGSWLGRGCCAGVMRLLCWSVDSCKSQTLPLSAWRVSVGFVATDLENLVRKRSTARFLRSIPGHRTDLVCRRRRRSLGDRRCAHRSAVGYVGAMVLVDSWEGARTERLNSSEVLGSERKVHGLARSW